MRKSRDKTIIKSLSKLWLLIPMIVILTTFTGCMGIIYQVARVAAIAEKVATSTPSPPADPDVHNAGMYKVGVDIDAGLYYVTSDKHDFGSVEVDSDSTGSVESQIAFVPLRTFTFISVQDGQYLGVTDGHFKLASKVPAIAPVGGKYGSGTYRIGLDLPAGEYQVIANKGDSGYYEASSDCSGNMDSVISNDFFPTQSYVTVKDGDYLRLDDCYIVAK